MTPEARSQRLGLVILLTGFFAAALVYRHTAPKEFESGAEDTMSFTATRRTGSIRPSLKPRNGQDNWTKANAKTAEFTLWLASWCHGRRLAYTLAGFSVAGALGCFFLANFEFEVAPPPARRTEGRDGEAKS